MDEYLIYLVNRIKKMESSPKYYADQIVQARAEYNRALDFARRSGLTER